MQPNRYRGNHQIREFVVSLKSILNYAKFCVNYGALYSFQGTLFYNRGKERGKTGSWAEQAGYPEKEREIILRY
jgi:hypothetical protein